MNMKKYLGLATVVLLAGIISATWASAPQTRGKMFLKPGTLEYILFDANQIRCWTGNNGEIVSYNVTGDAGLEWPKGSGRTAVFQSGLWLAGKVDGQVRSAASEYASEFQPGRIIYDTGTKVGYADNPNSPRYQVWSINKGDSPDETSPKYNREYKLWPVKDGAPAHDGEYFTDANGNGVYDDGETFEDFSGDGVYQGPDGRLVEKQDPPLFYGDQTHWSVFNDYSAAIHAKLWNTEPLGVEIQTTVFGFDRADPLGNVMFIKWLLINKSGKTIQDAYVSMWSDADLGDANDDYVGCDTNLSVGYFYNGIAVDADYGSTPPAVGYDFFQGPIVPSPGDTALISGQLLPGYRNLPMTSFVKYINGHAVYYDPETAEEAYNYMSGLTATGAPWKDPQGRIVTVLHPGDPITRTGDTEFDGGEPPGDRRFLMNSGPFTMATWSDVNGDSIPQVGEPGVQEIVGAIVIAAGTNNLNSIAAMKFFDEYAQNAYNTQFNLPSPPAPVVQVSELDKQIILSWEQDADLIENYKYLGYEFEGYNVYQGESPNGPWKLVKTFDISNAVGVIMDRGLDIETGLILEGPVAFGGDNGVSRLIDIRSDAIRGNSALINGRTYYFAVTTYAYNPSAAPKVVESSKKSILVRPHEPALGQKLPTSTGDALPVEHTAGVGEATVTAEVINPLDLNGNTFAVTFDYDSVAKQGSWNLLERDASGTLVDTLIKNETELTSYTSKPIKGFQFNVKDVSFESPILYYKWEQTSNIIPTLVDSVDYPPYTDGVDTIANIGGQPVKIDTLVGETKYWQFWSRYNVSGVYWFRLKRTVKHDVMVEGNAKNIGGSNALMTTVKGFGDVNNCGITDPVLLRSDIELRFTTAGQKAVYYRKKDKYAFAKAFLGTVPFEVWDVERNKQICLAVVDNNSDSLMGDATAQTLQNDWVVFVYKDYSAAQDSIYPLIPKDWNTGAFAGRYNKHTGWLIYLSSASIYSVGDTVRLYFLNPVEAGVDEYAWEATPLTTNLTKKEKQSQLKKINVFPNPYFAYNVEEKQPIERFVTITHLPEQDVTIRVFSLAGQLVTRIDHNTSAFAGTSFERWDLRNQYGIPVASGMYIIHVNVKGVGDKVLKIAVFQPEERLDVY